MARHAISYWDAESSNDDIDASEQREFQGCPKGHAGVLVAISRADDLVTIEVWCQTCADPEDESKGKLLDWWDVTNVEDVVRV